MLKKSVDGTITTKLSQVLFSYRITPQTTTGLSPAEMLYGRKLRCSMDFIHPDLTRISSHENSTPIVAKETEGTGTEDISSNPSEVSGDFSQHSEIITKINKPASPVVIMRWSHRTRNLPTRLKDYELK